MIRNDTGEMLVGLLVLLIVFAILRPMCTPKVVVPPDPNEELAKVAREAIEMAREAREEAASVRASSDRWFFISLAAAVAAPLVIAVLFFKFYANTPPDEAEVVMQLLRLADAERRKLPPPEHKALAGPSNEDGSAPRRRDN